MEWNQGDLVWFDPGGLGHPLPGEIQEVHQAAQIIVVQAMINGKVNIGCVLEVYTRESRLLSPPQVCICGTPTSSTTDRNSQLRLVMI